MFLENTFYHLSTNKQNSIEYTICDFLPDQCSFATLEEHISDREYFKLVLEGVSSVPSNVINLYRDGLSLEDAQEYYRAWKIFDAKAVKFKDRRPNLPGYLTESIVALCYGAKLIRKGSGDLILPDRSIGEAKGSSSPGPSSFGPKEWFDNLYYCKYLRDTNGTFLVYDLKRNRNDLNKIQVGKGLTFEDQSNAGRRARFSIDIEIIIPENIRPEFQIMLNKHTPELRRLV